MRRCIRQWLVIHLFLLLPNQIHAAVWDSNFGDRGVTLFNFDMGTTALQRLPDGRFVIGGYSGSGSSQSAFLAAVGADGSVDSSFGSGGTRTISGQTALYTLGAGSSGTLLAGVNGGVARLLANGSLDSTFGNGGVAKTNLSASFTPSDVAVHNDGRILAVGGTFENNADGASDMVVAGFTASGQQSWVRQETISLGLHNDVGRDVLVQQDGKILVAAAKWEALNCCPPQASEALVLLRYNSDGTPDSTFGGNGRVTAPIPSPNPTAINNPLYKLYPLADGGILTVGGDVYGQQTLAKFTANGAKDGTFANGRVVVQFSFGGPHPQVKILPDGTIRLVSARGTSLYERDFNAAGQMILDTQYEIPKLPQMDGNVFALGQSLLLDDGDLIVVGHTWDVASPANTNLFIGRIDSNFSAVPEPSGLLMLVGVIGIVSKRSSAKAHRRGRR